MKLILSALWAACRPDSYLSSMMLIGRSRSQDKQPSILEFVYTLSGDGRSCQDAIAQNFMRVQSGRDTWVLEADIKGFFDNIVHKSILKQLGNFPRKALITGWLKAGFIFEGKFNPTFGVGQSVDTPTKTQNG